MKEEILVFGHRNPDTDSICSSIAMANLRKKQGFNTLACRLVEINKETSFVLDKAAEIDEKNVELVKRFVSDKGKINPSRLTGANATLQRTRAKAIKRA
ncbi:MAG: 30S ribosomal protein S18, partial [Fusobacterium gastrosuis]|nr:30S ribosomal protein S18 [Fusobacterium gastrosuis]